MWPLAGCSCVSSWGKSRLGSSLGNGGGEGSSSPAVCFQVGMREGRLAGCGGGLPKVWLHGGSALSFPREGQPWPGLLQNLPWCLAGGTQEGLGSCFVAWGGGLRQCWGWGI